MGNKEPDPLISQAHVVDAMKYSDLKEWSPRLESNQYPTLRRHVHYPLCYGEEAGSAKSGNASQDELAILWPRPEDRHKSWIGCNYSRG